MQQDSNSQINGWEKLRKDLVFSELFQNDKTAFVVYVGLLMLSRNGKWTSGRKRLGSVLGLNQNTAWSAIKRLSKMGYIEIETSTKWSIFHLKSNRGSTTWQQPSNNLSTTCQHPKNLCYSDTSSTTWQQPSNNLATTCQHKIKTKTKTIKEKINKKENSFSFLSVHQKICELFDKNPERYKLTPKRKQKLQSRLKEFGEDGVLQACKAITQSAFHMGENDRGWSADPYWVLNSVEKTEEWLNKFTDVDIDLSKLEIEV